jgi:hypothetical protein
MNNRQLDHKCRWAVPTVFLPYPLWLEGEHAPWSCECDGTAVPLETTETCLDCPRFERAADSWMEQAPGSES